jgi:ferritin
MEACTMIKKKVQEALNEQINAELYSSYLYLSMAAKFENMSLEGFAHWMTIQAQEELSHAMKLYDYVNERGGRVYLKGIEEPPREWKSTLDVFEAVYNHEQKVTSLINKLVDLSIKEKDHATTNFLQWFVKEQVEEEASADSILQKVKLVGSGDGIFLLDKELGQRPPVFTLPVGKE